MCVSFAESTLERPSVTMRVGESIVTSPVPPPICRSSPRANGKHKVAAPALSDSLLLHGVQKKPDGEFCNSSRHQTRCRKRADECRGDIGELVNEALRLCSDDPLGKKRVDAGG